VHLFSTPASVRRREISLLAIVETIGAMSFSVWLAWWLDSIQHIALAVALAPFLLLRTPKSTLYTLRLVAKYASLQQKNRQHFTTFIPFFVNLAIIKICAALMIFFRNPLKSMRAVPGNFYKNIAVIDMKFPPQIFPGMEDLGRRVSFPNIYEMWQTYAARARVTFSDNNLTTVRKHFTVTWNLLDSLYPMIVMSVVYRWTLKGTALIWLPLLWIVRQVRPITDIYTCLILATRSAWARIMLLYSGLALLAFLVKCALLLGIWHFTNLNWLGQLGIAATRIVRAF